MKLYIVYGDEIAIMSDSNYRWTVKGFFSKEKADTMCSLLQSKAEQLYDLPSEIAQKEMRVLDAGYTLLDDYYFYPTYFVEEVEVDGEE